MLNNNELAREVAALRNRRNELQEIKRLRKIRQDLHLEKSQLEKDVAELERELGLAPVQQDQP